MKFKILNKILGRGTFGTLQALRTLQVSVVIDACVVTPLNSGQSILLSSPRDQKAFAWTVSPWLTVLYERKW